MLTIKIDGIEQFQQQCKNKKLVCYGAGQYFLSILDEYKMIDISEKIEYLVDADTGKYRTSVTFENNKWEVISVEDLTVLAEKVEIVLLITVKKYIKEVILALDSIPQLDGICAYIATYLNEHVNTDENITLEGVADELIPRKIHYCWFGGNEIPEKYKKYFETWKSHNPDYELIRWDETNYDVKKNKYMKQAYDAGKWAFVSDYARIDVVNEFGGIYLDCDIEVLKSFDPLLKNKMFCGFEYGHVVNLGIGFGAIAHHPYLRDLLHFYDTIKFLDNGEMNLTPCTVYQTEMLEKYGIRRNGTFQKTESVTVFPQNIFSPVSYYQIGSVSNTTISVHHYDASWIDDDYTVTWRYLQDTGKWLYERYKQQNNK